MEAEPSAPRSTDSGAPDVPVVAAVVEREHRFLVALRPEDKRHGGLWEFPGGKVGPSEDPRSALTRELQEELGMSLRSVEAPTFSFRDPGSSFVVHFHPADAEGDPEPREHQELRWVHAAELLHMDLAPADAAFAFRLLAARSSIPLGGSDPSEGPDPLDAPEAAAYTDP